MRNLALDATRARSFARTLHVRLATEPTCRIDLAAAFLARRRCSRARSGFLVTSWRVWRGGAGSSRRGKRSCCRRGRGAGLRGRQGGGRSTSPAVTRGRNGTAPVRTGQRRSRRYWREGRPCRGRTSRRRGRRCDGDGSRSWHPSGGVQARLGPAELNAEIRLRRRSSDETRGEGRWYLYVRRRGERGVSSEAGCGCLLCV